MCLGSMVSSQRACPAFVNLSRGANLFLDCEPMRAGKNSYVTLKLSSATNGTWSTNDCFSDELNDYNKIKPRGEIKSPCSFSFSSTYLTRVLDT